jgi:hypothetical protein
MAEKSAERTKEVSASWVLSVPNVRPTISGFMFGVAFLVTRN